MLTNQLTKNAYFDKNSLSANVNKSNDSGEIAESDNSLSTGMLGNKNNQMTLPGTDKNNRSRQDSETASGPAFGGVKPP